MDLIAELLMTDGWVDMTQTQIHVDLLSGMLAGCTYTTAAAAAVMMAEIICYYICLHSGDEFPYCTCKRWNNTLYSRARCSRSSPMVWARTPSDWRFTRTPTHWTQGGAGQQRHLQFTARARTTATGMMQWHLPLPSRNLELFSIHKPGTRLPRPCATRKRVLLSRGAVFNSVGSQGRNCTDSIRTSNFSLIGAITQPQSQDCESEITRLGTLSFMQFKCDRRKMHFNNFQVY